MSYLRTIAVPGIVVRIHKEKIEDSMEVIKKHNRKNDRQHYEQNKRTNNELQNTTQKIKD
jgi:hypothetical protein